jgi:hypothetical protein
MKSIDALLRFHVHVGGRVALRSLAPVLAAAFGLFYLLRPELFLMLAKRLFGEAAPISRGAVTAIALAVAAGMSRKAVCYGLGGWIRHLPVTGSAHRRAAVVAVALAETPITVVLSISMLFGVQDTPQSAVAGAIGLALASLAAAVAVVPSRNAGLRIALGGTAAVLAGSGRILLCLPALILLVAADRLSGSLHIARPGHGRRRWTIPIGFPALISWRALGMSGWTGFLPAGAIVGFTALFLNNNELSPDLRAAAMRTGGMLSVAAFLAVTAGLLVAGRAPWPWSRSWPRSSRRRIIADTLFLGIPAVLLLGPLAWIGGPAVVGAAFYLPAGAVRAAGAVNSPRETRARILGTLLLEGSLAAAAGGLWNAAGLVFLALTPFLLIAAARREQTLKVTGWDELHHSAVGDSGSWSGR